MREFGYIKSIASPTDKMADGFLPKITLPSSYDLSKDLPYVRDQGLVPKCVSVALTDMVTWHMMSDKSSPKFQDDYFFSNRQNKAAEGMSPKEAFEILRTKGAPSDKGNYNLKIYAKVNSFMVAKTAIVSNGPILIALPVYSYDTEFWKGGTNLLGGHAVLLTGFNSSGFVLRNSWGSSYGQGGYSTLPYQDFNLIYESWTLIN